MRRPNDVQMRMTLQRVKPLLERMPHRRPEKCPCAMGFGINSLRIAFRSLHEISENRRYALCFPATTKRHAWMV
jgi:hypothetical protein